MKSKNEQTSIIEKISRFKPSAYFSKEFTSILREYVGTQKSFSSAKDNFSNAKVICNYLEKDFFDITEEDVEKFFSYLACEIKAGRYSEISYNIKICHLTKLTNYINENHDAYYMENHFSHVKPMKYYSGIRQSSIPQLNTMDRILTTAKKMDYMAYVILVLCFRTGRSASDIVNLRGRDISDTHGTMTITVARGKTPYTVILPEDVAKILRTYMDSKNIFDSINEKDSHLFLNCWGRPLTLRNLDALVKKIMIASGENYKLKDIRSRAIIDMVSCSTKEELQEIKDYTGIQSLRLESYISAVALSDRSPASRVNIRIVDNEENQDNELIIE